MTGRSKGLMVLNNEELIRINQRDAKKLNLKQGEMVSVSSRRGNVEVKVDINSVVREGIV